jgi:hypothetical protein
MSSPYWSQTCAEEQSSRFKDLCGLRGWAPKEGIAFLWRLNEAIRNDASAGDVTHWSDGYIGKTTGFRKHENLIRDLIDADYLKEENGRLIVIGWWELNGKFIHKFSPEQRRIGGLKAAQKRAKERAARASLSGCQHADAPSEVPGDGTDHPSVGLSEVPADRRHEPSLSAKAKSEPSASLSGAGTYELHAGSNGRTNGAQRTADPVAPGGAPAIVAFPEKIDLYRKDAEANPITPEQEQQTAEMLAQWQATDGGEQ